MKKTLLIALFATILALAGCVQPAPDNGQNLNRTFTDSGQATSSDQSTAADCSPYTLDEAHRITEQTNIPQRGTTGEDSRYLKSPTDDSPLTEIVIDPDDPNVMDESWRSAYYSETENIFWIADMPGEVGASSWYGPFMGRPCVK